MTQTDHKPQIEKEYLQYKQSIKDCYPELLKNSSKEKKQNKRYTSYFIKEEMLMVKKYVKDVQSHS